VRVVDAFLLLPLRFKSGMLNALLWSNCFAEEGVVERRDSTFDATRQDGLSLLERPQEEIWVLKRAHTLVEATELRAGFAEQPGQPGRHTVAAMEVARDEGVESLPDVDELSSRRRREVGRFHSRPRK
jgi:hypothetical protein